MKRTEIEAMDNEVITSEELDELWESEEVDTVDCLGDSSSHPGCEWFSVTFTDGDDIDVFVEKDNF